MFWGWYSSGDGGARRGGGCLFLPFLFICGSLFLFDNLNVGWLVPLVVGVIVWFVVSSMFNRGGQPQADGAGWEDQAYDEKPKRAFGDEKPKRQPELLYRDDGDVLEVIEPPDAQGHTAESDAGHDEA